MYVYIYFVKYLFYNERPYHQLWGAVTFYRCISINFSRQQPSASSTDDINVLWGRPRLAVLLSLNKSLFEMHWSLFFRMFIRYFSCWLLTKEHRSLVLEILSRSSFVYRKLQLSSRLLNPPWIILLKYPI